MANRFTRTDDEKGAASPILASVATDNADE